ncbi:MAG TPA: glycoside hydrolase family 15 protein, partial [Candidatus Acidoferrales bacterium]|nr:glycoside hydrolase family 15 protein [Candidatus Acidoferrales bacterium]
MRGYDQRVALRIEDYALIGDCHTAALVGRDGSIDWLCLPRFDSSACFAALLGSADHGRWQITPTSKLLATKRRYRGDTLILETDFESEQGRVRVIDSMPPRARHPHVVRLVVGLDGAVDLHMELVIRFDCGRIVPWVRQVDGVLQAIAGPDSLCLRSPIATRGEDLRTLADFTIHPGEEIPFVLSWYASHEAQPRAVDAQRETQRTEEWWTHWSKRSRVHGPWRDVVTRSLITLKALTYAPTGGIVAAATTSLPEQLGGSRNWDYRLCWLRDTTFTLYALMLAGYEDEAVAWRDWFLRAVAGDPTQLQIMYGPAGERRLSEWEVPWLPGYEGSTPVRIGNAAHEQL